MSVRLQQSDGEESQSKRDRDEPSPGTEMLVSEAYVEDIHPTVAPNRRLRNWILLANALAWLVIIVAARWLFF